MENFATSHFYTKHEQKKTDNLPVIECDESELLELLLNSHEITEF